jgi:hypothetical protein
VKTVADLQGVLSTPNDKMIFVESVMGPHDAPAAVIHSSNRGAELDYGHRGPQHRANAQLQLRRDDIAGVASCAFSFWAVRGVLNCLI